MSRSDSCESRPDPPRSASSGPAAWPLCKFVDLDSTQTRSFVPQARRELDPWRLLPTTALDRARAKAYIRLLPLLFLSYVIAYVDRVNVGFAKLDMQEDLAPLDSPNRPSASAWGSSSSVTWSWRSPAR